MESSCAVDSASLLTSESWLAGSSSTATSWTWNPTTTSPPPRTYSQWSAAKEGVGTGSLSGEPGHFLDAGLVGLPTSRVGALQETVLLTAVSAGAAKGLEESGDGHVLLSGLAQWAHPHPAPIDSRVLFLLRRPTRKTGEIRKEVHCPTSARGKDARTESGPIGVPNL